MGDRPLLSVMLEIVGKRDSINRNQNDHSAKSGNSSKIRPSYASAFKAHAKLDDLPGCGTNATHVSGQGGDPSIDRFPIPFVGPFLKVKLKEFLRGLS